MLNDVFTKVKIIINIFVINNLICKLNIQLYFTSKKTHDARIPICGIIKKGKENSNSFNICGIGVHLHYLEL